MGSTLLIHDLDLRSPVFQPQTAALATVPMIQAKLKVGELDDKFEEEADRVAELTGNDHGSIPPSAVARSRSPVGSLQRLYSNQAVLQMRHGSGGPPAPSMPLRPSQSGILQRKCACGGAAGMSGECEECSKKKRLGLQTKLKVNEPGDIYEREADRIADQVMATPAHSKVSSAPPRIQRFAGQPTGQMDAAPASVDQALASPGRPLEPALRQDMEQRFGHDFSQVRVHSGATAEQSARDVNAHAYTVGHDLVFGTGQFAPGTHEGRRLIAHELTHVVQQSGSDATRLDQSNEKRGLSLIHTIPTSIPTRSTVRRQPARLDLCLLRPSNELAPREWLRCAYSGRIQPDNEYPLRFTNTGVVATRDELAKWVDREGITQEVAIKRVMHSHEFAGTGKAREEAKAALINAFPMEKLRTCS